MDPGDHRHFPLLNLSNLQSQINHIQLFLSDSLNTNTIISTSQIEIITNQITDAINGAIVNGAALISTNSTSVTDDVKDLKQSELNFDNLNDEIDLGFPNNNLLSEEIRDGSDFISRNSTSFAFNVIDWKQSDVNFNNLKDEIDLGVPKNQRSNEEIGDDSDIVELDAVELLAEHLHFCDYCGKGFKRDANLRMHMRAHGNKFKTLEALSKPEKLAVNSESTEVKKTRFSCPFSGCSRNKLHKKFRPLKSVICVKNHFKRSHCPKMYSCNRCHKKSFSVLADLKSHLKHCGEIKWKCSCGTSFSRKDKLFGHIALFEGHMPAMMAAEVVVEDDGKGKGAVVVSEVVEDADVKGMEWADDDVFFDGLGLIDDDFCLQDVLGGGSDWNL